MNNYFFIVFLWVISYSDNVYDTTGGAAAYGGATGRPGADGSAGGPAGDYGQQQQGGQPNKGKNRL